MTSIRKICVLAFVTTLALAPAGAATIGGEPRNDAVLIESPPTFGSCRPPIAAMSGVNFGVSGGSFVVSNRSSSRARDTIVFDLVVEGRKRMFWTSVDLRPGSTATATVEFLKSVTSPVVILCGDHPVGIIDGPDPVLTVTVGTPVE